MKCEHTFFGSVTVGERGQVVIPAEARNELGIAPGDKLLVMKAPHHTALLMCKFEALQDFITDFAAAMSKVEADMQEEKK